MESHLDRQDPADALDEEIAFWREFVRRKQRMGDLEMVRQGQRALARAIRLRQSRSERPTCVVRFPDSRIDPNKEK